MGFFIHYRLVCNLVLISFLALCLAKLTSTIVMSFGFTTPPTRSEIVLPNSPPIRESKDIRSYEKIIDRNIFDSEKHSPDEGKEPAALEPPKPTLDLNSVPIKSTLGAKLVGTIVTSSKESSIAIIEKSGATDRYHIDDLLDGDDGKITEILRNKVIFIRDFHREYLEIEDTTPEIEFVENYAPDSGGGFEGGITEVEKNRFAIDKTRFDKALKNINQILFNAASMPNIVDGKIEGFRILDIDTGSIFDELKILNNDIIVSVNNKSLNDLKSVFTLFETLQKEKFFEIQVERDGERFTRTYEVK
jgi:general secretion pathway protein C